MFSNHFFLKRLASSISERVCDLTLLEIFSQNKNELILGFASSGDEFWIKANLDPNISLISFPSSFSRAKKNSVDLFSSAIGNKILSCDIFTFERSFQIKLENQKSIIFKMHGRRANILLAEKDQVVKIFRKNLHADVDIKPEELNKKLDVNEQSFRESDFQPTALIPALGKEVRSFWNNHFDQKNDNEKWSLLESLLVDLETNPIKLVSGESPSISLLALLEYDEETMDPIFAANWLYEKKAKGFYVDKEKSQIVNDLKQQIKKSESYIIKTSGKLRVAKNQRSPEEVANILMANLNTISKGLKKVTLNDFYIDELIEIKLNPLLSPQKNAENLYRKSKNRHQEIEMLEKNISAKEKAIEELSAKILLLQELDNIKEIRKFSKKSTQENSSKNEAKMKPYHQFEMDGWEILVGKNAKANDELTLKVATKNDLWLHAKDVSGSHVVIRQKPGQNFPNHVIEYAAGIAAFNSKRKTDSLCPVSFTPKKFIRKVKGALPGQVVVAKEEVVIVKPIDTSGF